MARRIRPRRNEPARRSQASRAWDVPHEGPDMYRTVSTGRRAQALRSGASCRPTQAESSSYVGHNRRVPGLWDRMSEWACAVSTVHRPRVTTVSRHGRLWLDAQQGRAWSSPPAGHDRLGRFQAEPERLDVRSHVDSDLLPWRA